jgi:hypothetical protein
MDNLAQRYGLLPVFSKKSERTVVTPGTWAVDTGFFFRAVSDTTDNQKGAVRLSNDKKKIDFRLLHLFVNLWEIKGLKI